MTRKENAAQIRQLVTFYQDNIAGNIPTYARACVISLQRVRTYQTSTATEDVREMILGTRKALRGAIQCGAVDPYQIAVEHIHGLYVDVGRRIAEAQQKGFLLRDNKAARLRQDIESLFNYCLYLDNLRHNLRTQPETELEHKRLAETFATKGQDYNPEIAEIYHNCAEGELRDWEVDRLTPPISMLCYPSHDGWAKLEAAWQKKFPKEKLPWSKEDLFSPIQMEKALAEAPVAEEA